MCRRIVFCISVIWVSIPISFNQFLNFMGVGPRAPISNGITLTFMFGISKLPCQILVLFYFFLILVYPLFRHEDKQNILSGKGFYLSVPQWHLVISHIFHDPFVLWSPIACYVYHFPLLPPACAPTTFISLVSHIFYILPKGSSFYDHHFIIFLG